MKEPSKIDTILKWTVVTMVALVIVFTDVQAHHVLIASPTAAPVEDSTGAPAVSMTMSPTASPTVSPTPTVTEAPTPTVTPTLPLVSVEMAEADEIEFLRQRDGVEYEQVLTIMYQMVSYCLGLINGEWVLIEYSFG